jgi:hypothetical protein
VRAAPNALGVGAVSGLLTACGGSGVAAADVVRAATKTSAVRSSRVTTTTKLPSSARPVTFTADGSFEPWTAGKVAGIDFSSSLRFGRAGDVGRETSKENLTLRGQKTSIAASLELSDFGAPVLAPLPPAVDVTELTGASKGTQS